MFRNVIESYTGYIQIQHEDFWDNKTVDNVFEYTPQAEQSIMSDRNVISAIPRFESFALISSGSLTKGVLVMGVDAEKENNLSDVKGKLVKYRLTDDAIENLKKTNIPEKLKRNLDLFKNNSYSGEGSLQVELGISKKAASDLMPPFRKFASFNNGYIENGKPGALIGDKLSRYLKLNIGDTIVLIGQGYHGTSAAAKFIIYGIVKLPTPDLDNSIVYLPFNICQEFYNAPGMLTSIALFVRNNDEKEINATIARITGNLKPPLKVLGWREMNGLMVNQMDADNKSGMIMVGILYLVIAFGIFGTVLMMTAERRREFGVLVAVGMQKTKLAAVVSIEMLYIGMMGIISGSLFAIPVILIGYYHPLRFSGEFAKMYEDYGMEPVMPFLPINWYFLWQTVVVAIIVIIAVVYPVRKILKMKIVDSLKA
jgi:ABC-type lipoprotein release transport system permease subunit